MGEPGSYVELDQEGVRRHLAARPALAARLGGAPGDWAVREVSDGNLNSVFLVEGQAGGLCVKQSLPHVRVDPAWKLPLDRAFFEAAYMRAVAPHVGSAAPALLDYEPALFCLVMESLTPHVILRRGLIERAEYPRMASDVGAYVARACFATSGLARRFEAVMDDIALFARNQTLTRITVDLVFTDPYRIAPRNRWTAPLLDTVAADIRGDTALKQAAARMGERFLGRPQALLHGDLHSGSVMVTAEETRIIDGEFALMGPIGFDLGLFVANLLLSLFSQPGHDEAGAATYQAWIAAQIETVWTVFDREFRRLWNAASANAAGDVMPSALLAGEGSRNAMQESWMADIHDDMLGFAGMEMIRRILGFAHVLDLESIGSDDTRAACELQALAFARRLLVERSASGGIGALLRQRAGRLPS
ncbi:S-methyl-5-thioribose kinase [Lichenicoccus roseus]|uniref:S-methyl-5-thioribose kinase n=1 Tax=Lichenicoccus roseus TaxID=2683649 RepID=A0A5R9J240_9PROT|nr:S-methyl-5-thioribose kinase [Lichenicoccus roseus]TLU71029.1 S-methyl-5-thioribose kinase [Lichenicoccus roseus]